MTLEGQVKQALVQGYAITPRPAGAPQDPQYLTAVRQLAVQAVYQIWNIEHRAAALWDIYHIVTAKIQDHISTPAAVRLPWKAGIWQIPSKRTVDRRVNEGADPRFYEGTSTPIIALSPGLYLPNPRNFDGETRTKLEQLLR